MRQPVWSQRAGSADGTSGPRKTRPSRPLWPPPTRSTLGSVPDGSRRRPPAVGWGEGAGAGAAATARNPPDTTQQHGGGARRPHVGGGWGGGGARLFLAEETPGRVGV